MVSLLDALSSLRVAEQRAIIGHALALVAMSAKRRAAIVALTDASD
ncbi:MAG: hypothetical protein IPH13_06065 [Planctomycetes bacterium]|nr:hypothetical protein [Planctomycetota bacterium]